MKGKYINTKILLACLSTTVKKDIHRELQETIAEHKKIMWRFWEKLLDEPHYYFEMQEKEAA